jgi:hypothetical protein
VQTVHRQVATSSALQLVEVIAGMEFSQFSERRLARGDFVAPFAAEQTEGFQALAGEGGAFGFKGTIWRVTQPFNFGRVQKGQFAVTHAENGVMPSEILTEKENAAKEFVSPFPTPLDAVCLHFLLFLCGDLPDTVGEHIF